jgi:HK97 family phage major capsid protein
MLRGSDSHLKEHPVMSDAITLTHPQAVNRLKDIDDEMGRLQNKDQLTPEDEVTFAELTREFDELDEYRKKMERTAERARVAEVRAKLNNPNGNVRLEGPAGHTSDGYDRDMFMEPDSIEEHRFRDPWKLEDMRMFGESPEVQVQELRARAFSAIEKMASTKDKVRQTMTEIIEEFDDVEGNLSRQCLLTSSPAYLRGFAKMAKGHQSLLTPEEQRALNASRAMSTTTTAGGFLIPFQLDPTVILTSDGSLNEIRQIARKVVATGNKWNGVSSVAVSWSYDTEGSEVSDDATAWAQPAIDIYTGRGFVPISLEARMDEANVAAEVARLLAQGKDDKEAVQFATGSGSGPQGIVTALAASSPSVIVLAAADDTFARGDVDKVKNALPARYRKRSSWLAHNSIYSLVRAFDTSGGSAFWADMNDDRPAKLIGRPIYEAEAMDGTITTAGAVANYAMIVGDFENYVIADRIGITVDFVPHLFDVASNLPNSKAGWLAYYRVGADSVNDGGFRMLNVASAT